MAFDIKQLNKLSKREKNLVGIMLLVLSSLPLFQFTLPTWNKYIESTTKIRDGENKLRDLVLRIKKLEKLKGENIKISKKIESQKLYLAKSYEIDFLVQDLKKICDESSISLESFTPTNPEPVNIILEKQVDSKTTGKSVVRGRLKQALDKLKGQDLPVDLYRFPIEVKVTGDFTDIIELFKKLEKYGRVISVENISIGKIQAKQAFENRLTKSKTKKQSTDTSSLLSTFDLVAYSLPGNDEKIAVNQLQKNLSTSMSSYRFKKNR
ncbi:MAG: type 4a pilus biogenesis protein PilO [Candidatus Melainabacteria bacterium]|nr:type 4a pilus biogenesis protein PilO [Candidatus Melainabacteria bacterium]